LGKRGTDRLYQADSFRDQAMQLSEDRRVPFGLVVLLVPCTCDVDEARLLESRELPMDRARTAANEADELSALITTLRLAEQ